MRFRSSRPLLAVLVVAATACGSAGSSSGETSSSGPATDPPATTEVSEGSTPPADNADGVLTIGVLLPQTGAANDIGLQGINAANVAVANINENGGVLGSNVVLVRADEGDTVEQAQAAIDSLLSQNVDAIVGPASSTVALETLDDLMQAGVVVCSPTASALALNHYPNRNLFFRTIPSDSIMAGAMAQLAQNTGVDSVTVVYLDDGYGRPLARMMMERLNELEIDDVTELPFTATDDDLTDDADAWLGNPTGTVIVIADSIQGWRMMAAIAQVVEDDPPFIIASPAMREAQPETLVAMPAAVREAIQGVSPTARHDDDAAPAGDYAVNTHDCVNLIALATISGGSDSPETIARWVPDVSVVGEQCLTFQRCVQILEDGRNINYQGLGRLIDLTQRGDPERARVEIFNFNEAGLDFVSATMLITDPDFE